VQPWVKQFVPCEGWEDTVNSTEPRPFSAASSYYAHCAYCHCSQSLDQLHSWATTDHASCFIPNLELLSLILTFDLNWSMVDILKWNRQTAAHKGFLVPWQCGADHAPPYSAEVKNGEAVPPFSHSLQGMVFNWLSKGITLPLSSGCTCSSRRIWLSSWPVTET
jgi:hypothetical protein